MENFLEGNYKGIAYKAYNELSLLEMNLHENGIVSNEEFISKVLVFIELVEHVLPKYVLFNKSVEDFEISPTLWQFTQVHIVAELFRLGVEEIFFLVTPQRLDRYQGKLPENIHAFWDIEQLVAYIKSRQITS